MAELPGKILPPRTSAMLTVSASAAWSTLCSAETASTRMCTSLRPIARSSLVSSVITRAMSTFERSSPTRLRSAAIASVVIENALTVVIDLLPPESGSSCLLHQRLGTALQFCGRDVLDVRGERPHVAERVDERPGAVAVELVLQRPRLHRARGQRLREARVDVLDVEQEADRRAAQRPRAVVTHLGMLVGEHDHRVPDADFSVADLAAGGGEAHQLL